MPRLDHNWPRWTATDWQAAELADNDSLPADWLATADASGRNILMACLHQDAPQEVVRSIFCLAAQTPAWHQATHHETHQGVGLLAHVFRFATQRRFDYGYWQELAVRASPIRSSAGNGLLWQLACLARNAGQPLAWFPGNPCIDPAWLCCDAADWQAGLTQDMTRPWLAGRLLRPLRHLSGTLQTSASVDLHELAKFLRPLHLHDLDRVDKSLWQPDLLDAMDVLHVVWTALDRYGIEKGFDPVHAWDPVLPALSRLDGYANLENGVFADLLSRHTHGDAGWQSAVARARSQHQAQCLEVDTLPVGEGKGGRRL